MGKGVTRIFVDTSALKAARDTQMVFIPRMQKLDWGDQVVEAEVYDMMYKNQNTAYLRNNPSAFQNRLHNRMVARLAKENRIELLISHEVKFEAMGVPSVDLSFYGSPLHLVRSPITHGGLVIDGSGRDHLFNVSVQTTPFFPSSPSRHNLPLHSLTGAGYEQATQQERVATTDRGAGGQRPESEGLL